MVERRIFKEFKLWNWNKNCSIKQLSMDKMNRIKVESIDWVLNKSAVFIALLSMTSFQLCILAIGL